MAMPPPAAACPGRMAEGAGRAFADDPGIAGKCLRDNPASSPQERRGRPWALARMLSRPVRDGPGPVRASALEPLLHPTSARTNPVSPHSFYLVVRNSAQGNTDRHRSMVEESKA